MLVAVMYWFKCYNHIMTSEKSPFSVRQGDSQAVPAPVHGAAFVPHFKAQIKRIHQAQKAMGLYAGSSYVDKLRSAVRVFSAMLTWALENAIDTGDSMKARAMA